MSEQPNAPTPAIPDAGWLLCFDASSPSLVMALGRVSDGKAEVEPVCSSALPDAGRTASVEFMPRIHSLCDEAGIKIDEIALLACGRGPGTFTGTRVAIATCKGLAFGLGRPVLPVSTLAALAASSERSGPVYALLDARKGEVYGAGFELVTAGDSADLKYLAEDSCAAVNDFFAAAKPQSGTVLGPGAERYRDQLPELLEYDPRFAAGPSPEGLWRASANVLAQNAAVTGAELQACYLRASYAEIGVHQPKTPRYVSPFVDG